MVHGKLTGKGVMIIVVTVAVRSLWEEDGDAAWACVGLQSGSSAGTPPYRWGWGLFAVLTLGVAH